MTTVFQTILIIFMLSYVEKANFTPVLPSQQTIDETITPNNTTIPTLPPKVSDPASPIKSSNNHSTNSIQIPAKTQQNKMQQLNRNENTNIPEIPKAEHLAPVPNIPYTPINANLNVNGNNRNNIMEQFTNQAQLPYSNNPTDIPTPSVDNNNLPTLSNNYIPTNIDMNAPLNSFVSSKESANALNYAPQEILANSQQDAAFANAAENKIPYSNLPNQNQIQNLQAENLPNQGKTSLLINNNINNLVPLQNNTTNVLTNEKMATLKYDHNNPKPQNYGIIPNDIVYVNDNNLNNGSAFFNATQAPNFNETEREMWKRDSTMPYICGSPPYRFYAKNPCQYYAVCLNGGFKVNVPCAQNKECLDLNPDTECVQRVCCTLPVVIGVLAGNSTSLPGPGAEPQNQQQNTPTVIYPPQNDPEPKKDNATKVVLRKGNLSISAIAIFVVIFHIKSLFIIQ